MGEPLLRIFQGPSGTGKTYSVARAAVEIIDGSVSVDSDTFNRRHKELVSQGRIWWVTFHPSYSYEDFVEGFRPSNTEGHVSYEVKNGPFKDACLACYPANATPRSLFSIGDTLGARNNYRVHRVEEGGVVLESKPGRSNEVVSNLYQYADFWTVRHLMESGVKEDELSPSGQDNDERRDLSARTGLPTTLFTNSGSYRAIFGRLEAAQTDDKFRDIVLIIDEINRADLSRVFGELLTLLEADKRAGASEERSVILPYSGDLFTIPPSLSVLGTMNTSDRSLALMDVALRRRFEFLEVNPNAELCPENYGGIRVRSLLLDWNKRIVGLISRDLQIGHSELMESALERVRVQRGWETDDGGRLRAFAATLRQKILPQLREHFYQDWKRIRIVLGIHADSNSEELLNPMEVGDILNLAPDYFDEDQAENFDVPEWWNPDSSTWNPVQFVDKLHMD
jgi:5-methylcytosine-specific restriction protein B